MSRRPESVAREWNRRQFLATSLACAWPLASLRITPAADRKIRLFDYPFQLGVASGDPAPDGVVLWTRLAVDPLNGGGMPPEDVAVDWQVAHDEAMTRIVRRGTATASADWAHSVHVEVEGLESDRTYFYQFRAGDDLSPVGRTRTAPHPASLPDRMQFAFASCQHFESGYFTAYDHMCRDDLQAVVHLGDYIYEGSPQSDKVRHHVGPELNTLDDYRARHAQYKMDRHLQAAHAAFPWIVTWDDHEFDNNYAGDTSEEPGISPQAFLKRRAQAYQAYYEHMPLRRSSLPQGPFMPIYRRIPYGNLINFSVLDTRQYRTDQPCGDRQQLPCAEVFDPSASLLGPEQEDWLCAGLRKSNAVWNVLAQQVMMARVDFMTGDAVSFSMDQWSGYDVARKRLLQFLADQRVANPVVLTGDIHSNWVNDLKVDFDRPEEPTVATEFVGTSITSGGDSYTSARRVEALLSENPFVRFYNAERGYVRCLVTPREWRSDYQSVDRVSVPGGTCRTCVSFVVEAGRPGAVQA